MSEELEFVELKRVISSILLSGPSGRTQKQLLDDYKKLLGRELPYRAHGYKTLLACLEDMHDSVRIERNGLDCVVFGIGDESTKHIQKLINRQKSSSAPRGRPSSRAYTAVVPERFKVQITELLTSYPDGLRYDRFSEAYAKRFGCYANYRNWGFASLDHVLGSIPDIVTCQRDNSKNAIVIRLSKRTTQPDNSRLGGRGGVSLNSLELTPDDIKANKKQVPSVPANIESRVKQLLTDKCSGIWASMFAAEYKAHFGEDFPYKENIVGFLSSLKACELQNDPNTSDWLVWSSDRKHCNGKSAEQGVPEDLSLIISTMVANHPKGVPLNKFAHIFKAEHGRELLFLPYGFFSVAEMLVHVPGVKVEKPSTCPEVMVLPVQGCFAQEGVASGTEAVEGPVLEKPKPERKVVLEHCPTGYVVQPYPSEKTCPVYVSYVKSPSCLYVQMIGETTSKALESLSEEMSQFYAGKEGRKYTIECVQIGQACCTVYSEDCYWYRAEVLDIPSADVAKVKYVDYGNVGLVPMVTLRRPKAHYMLLPAQALQCRLANIKPASEKWCERASLLLGTMTKDRPLVATITSVMNNTLSLYLCDTNTDKDIHISDRLVDQGLAIVAMDTVEDEAGFDGIHLEPPPSMTSEDIANIRPPSSCPLPPTSLPSAEMMAYFQQALWQLSQLTQIPPPTFNTSVAMPTNAPSSPYSPPVLPPHDCSSNSQKVANGGSLGTNSSPSGGKATTDVREDLSRDANLCSDPSGGVISCSVSQARPSANERGAQQARFVRRIQLTPTHTLHVLNHVQKALVLSSEVSAWFWDTDQLKTRLQQSSKQIWAQVLSRNRARQLFTALADHTELIESSDTSLIVYSLEDLPAIVQTFGGPEELGVSIRRELSLWKLSPTAYFSWGSEKEEEKMSLLEKQLQDLHMQRSYVIKQLSDVLMYDELGDVPDRLIQIEDKIRSLKNEMADKRRGLPTDMTVPQMKSHLTSGCASKHTLFQPDQFTPTQSCDPVATVMSKDSATLQMGKSRLHGLGRGTPYIKGQ